MQIIQPVPLWLNVNYLSLPAIHTVLSHHSFNGMVESIWISEIILDMRIMVYHMFMLLS